VAALSEADPATSSLGESRASGSVKRTPRVCILLASVSSFLSLSGFGSRVLEMNFSRIPDGGSRGEKVAGRESRNSPRAETGDKVGNGKLSAADRSIERENAMGGVAAERAGYLLTFKRLHIFR